MVPLFRFRTSNDTASISDQHHRQADENQHRDEDPRLSAGHRCRFHASASGAADSRARGIARIAMSARK